MDAGAHATFKMLHLPDESVMADGDAEVDCRMMCARAIGSPVWEFTTEPSIAQSKLVGCGGRLICCPFVSLAGIWAVENEAAVRMSAIDFT
jgi:hypothetical protein